MCSWRVHCRGRHVLWRVAEGSLPRHHSSRKQPHQEAAVNADVFGRVYDTNGEAAIDDTENIRIAYIEEIAPGASKVNFKLFVPLEQYELGPLKLTGFKASGFPGKMLPGQGSGLIGQPDAQALADCEITGDCEELQAASSVR